MPEREALDRAVYDHEIEDPHPRGERRRRHVDDWGVGEELFDRMPSRRFARSDAHVRRRPPHAPRAAAAATSQRELPPERSAPPEPDSAAEPALGAQPRIEPDAPTTPLAVVPGPAPGETPRVDVAGRRTVVISGRPGPLGQVPARRRPPRTPTERLGARPDRIVAWAVALGVLLILIAVATANAAVTPALLLPLAVPRGARRLPRPPRATERSPTTS